MTSALVSPLAGVAALVAGTMALPSAAQAACYAGPYPANVTGINTCITVTGTSFTGNLVNSGTVTPNGVTVSSSTINGQVVNAASGVITSGNVTPGIELQSDAVVTGGIVNAGSITGGTSRAGIFLNGTSTFSGGISNTGTLTSVDQQGVLIYQASAFSGGITNTGTITSQNTAVGVNTVSTFTGGIRNTGTIISGTAGIFTQSVDNFSGGITNGGTITSSGVAGLYVYGSSTFAGGISNAGTITASGGAGVLIGGAAGVVSTFAGGISNTGTISGATGIQVLNSGPISVFDSGVITGTGGTAVDLSGNSAGNVFTLGPGYAINGNVLGTGTDTFQLGGTGNGNFALANFGTQYSGFSTFNVVSGTWIATGTYAQMTAVTVQAGTLLVNGNLSNASNLLVSGGTLGGTGTVGNTSITGGTFQPGSGTPGSSMTVGGTLGFNAASTYAVNINPTTSSFANVSGAATLGTATVNASFAAGSYMSKQYTILTAGSIVGTFGTLTNTNLPANFTNSLSYDATHAYLNLVLNFTPPTPPGPTPLGFGNGLSGNQNNVGNALINYFNTTGGIPTVFGTLNGNGLSQASGQPGAATAQSGVAGVGQFANAIFDGAFGDDGGQGGAIGFARVDDDQASAYAPKQKVSREAGDAFARAMPVKAVAPSFASRWNIWATAYGGNARVNGDTGAGTSTTTSRIFGTAVGASYRFTPDTQLGFAMGGAGSSFSLDGGFGGGRADVFNAAAYAKHNWGAAYVAGLVGYSWQDTTTDRTVTIAGTDQLRANFKAQALTARLEGGWRFATPMVGVTPYAALQSTSFYLPSYGETATSGSNTFALNYASKTVTATRGELGAKFDKAMLVQGGVFTLKAKTAWAHDWNTDRTATATFQTLPGATFVVNGAQPSANAALLSLGGEMKWLNGWSLTGSFDGEFSRTTASYAGKGSVKYAW